MLIFNLVRKHGQISRAMLSELTGLSSSTISILVEELILNNMLREVGTDDNSARGRKPIMLEVDGSGAYFLVVEVISTGIICHLYDLLCRCVDTMKYRASAGKAGHPACDYAKALMKRNCIDEGLLFGINIIYPGIVDRSAQKLIYSVIVPEDQFFSDSDIDTLKNEFPDAMLLLTSYSSVTAYAEYAFSEQTFNKPILSVNIFEAVSAAAVIMNDKGEKVYDFPIELGHVSFDRTGPLCRCGNRGCLEAIVGSSRIFEKIEKQANLPLTYSNEFNDEINAKAMLRVKKELEAGNHTVIEIIDHVAEIIAFALISLSSIMDPYRIFINGTITLLGSGFIEKINKIYSANNLKHMEMPDILHMSRIDNEKRLKSGVLMVIDEVFAFSNDAAGIV